MSAKKENITRLKEATLLLCFLLLLFSFSGRSFTKQGESPNYKTELRSFLKNNPAVASPITFVSVSKSTTVLDIPEWLKPATRNLLLESKKISLQISLLARHYPLIKARTSFTLYYLLSSIKKDDFPFLG